MQIYSVAQVMGVRDLYREAPYPGFSLDEVIRRKRTAAGMPSLPRGENAWKVSNAKTADEGIARIVQGALNKLAPEKYNEIIETFRNPALIATERAMQIVINLIFQKALQETSYIEMYARLCYDMACFEVQLQTTSPLSIGTPNSAATVAAAAATPTEAKRVSKFRENIVRIAQREFQLTDPLAFKDLQDEALDDARSNMIRRKRANITFIGQLHLHRVLSPGIMFTIMEIILKTQDPTAPPPEDVDIEVLAALLETIGKSIDRGETRDKMSIMFRKIESLQSGAKYTPRIKFKLLDLLDLRANGWESRLQNQAVPTTLQEQARVQSAKTLSMSAKSPTTSCTPNSRRGMQKFPSTNQFPDSPQPPSSSTAVTPPPSGSGANWRNNSTPFSPRTTNPAAGSGGGLGSRNVGAKEEPPVPFATRVKTLQAEWVAERSNEPIPNWRNKFRTYTEFVSEDDLTRAIVVEAVRQSCMVSQKDAQHEACSFLRVALQLEPEDPCIVLGLVDVLVRGIDEGIVEDVPKFYERYVSVLHMITEKETITELYCDAAKILYVTYEQIRSLENCDEPLAALLAVWVLLPRPSEDLSVTLPNPVVKYLVDLREMNQEEVAGALVVSLMDSGLVTVEAVEEWLKSTSAIQAPKTVQLVQERLQRK